MLVISWLEGKEDIFKECREKFKSTYIVSTKKELLENNARNIKKITKQNIQFSMLK